jgi:hypothetical protein
VNFCAGDYVSHSKKPHRGVGVIKTLVDGNAVLWYPKMSLTVGPVRVRDLVKEEPPK